MSRSLKPSADFADAARHVRAADKPIPPMNSESGRSVELLMMLVSVVAASPSDAMPTPDDVQMNCDSDSMIFVMPAILLSGSNRPLIERNKTHPIIIDSRANLNITPF